MKKNLTIVSFLLLLISLTSSLVIAEDVTPTVGVTGGLKQRVLNRIENRVEKRQEVKENLVDKLKDKIKSISVRIKGELTAISGNTLTVKKEDGTTVSVDTASATCRRRFGAKCEWSELAVGDILNVVGKWTDDTKTAITAKLVRNISIQKRFGVVFGKVTQINDGDLVIDSKKGDETLSVTIYTTGAKFVQRDEQGMTVSDIKVGHRIRAKGVWDRTLKEMRETSQVKDFDLPMRVKPTVTTSE